MTECRGPFDFAQGRLLKRLSFTVPPASVANSSAGQQDDKGVGRPISWWECLAGRDPSTPLRMTGLLGVGTGPLFLRAYRGAEALRYPKARLRGAFSLSPLWGLLFFAVLSHGLRPFDRLRAGCGLYSFAALRLGTLWPLCGSDGLDARPPSSVIGSK
jgi:hypothetical protein